VAVKQRRVEAAARAQVYAPRSELMAAAATAMQVGPPYPPIQAEKTARFAAEFAASISHVALTGP
jgi:hypothetical protein